MASVAGGFISPGLSGSVSCRRRIPMDDDAGEALLRFPCVCGKELEIPAEAAGGEMDCPWCSRPVIAPVRDGERATPAPEPAAAEEIDFERCPDCAGTCAGATCPICGVQARPAETYARLSVCAEQGVVPIDLADW